MLTQRDTLDTLKDATGCEADNHSTETQTNTSNIISSTQIGKSRH